jgi:hypothetical protein
MRTKLKLVDTESGLLNAALEIAQRRANTLRELRQALVRGDDLLAISLSRKVCGLKVCGLDDKKNHRTDSCKH